MDSTVSEAATLNSCLRNAPVVPLVQSNDPDEAVAVSEALLKGGLNVLEVVLRTDEAFHCLEKIASKYPNVYVGAGTVLSGDQARKAIDCGAKFLFSPGLDDDVVKISMNNGMPILPGIATATELQRAWNMGLRTVKFFPAGLAGGPKMIRALSSVFRDVSFMPTGGVSAENLNAYLSISAVLACGGSWLTPKGAVAAKNFEAITELAIEALQIVADLRSHEID